MLHHGHPYFLQIDEWPDPVDEFDEDDAGEAHVEDVVDFLLIRGQRVKFQGELLERVVRYRFVVFRLLLDLLSCITFSFSHFLRNLFWIMQLAKLSNIKTRMRLGRKLIKNIKTLLNAALFLVHITSYQETGNPFLNLFRTLGLLELLTVVLFLLLLLVRSLFIH